MTLVRRMKETGWLVPIVMLLAVWGCGEDESKTPACDELGIYDIHDDAAREANWNARFESEAKGCVTAPGDAATGSGGTAGASSSGGSAGSTSDAAAD